MSNRTVRTSDMARHRINMHVVGFLQQLLDPHEDKNNENVSKNATIETME